MLLTVLAILTFSSAGHQDPVAKPPISCAIMGDPSSPSGGAADYEGVRYSFCCPACVGAFQKNPVGAIHSEKVAGKTIGTSLFDPVSTLRVSEDQAKAWEDYKGVRYLFTSADEKKTFDAEPAKYTTYPAKEALFCPVEKEKLTYTSAMSYSDYNGVRYFFCCGACPAEFAKKPADFAKNAADYVKTPQALEFKSDKKDVAKADGPKADDTFVAETYACKHCGRPMTMNSPDDKKAVCSVCGCNKTAADCKPGGN